MQPLVEIENLETYFFTDEGTVKAVDGVSFVIPQGRTVGLVGESGCGKSVTAMSIMGLVSRPGRINGGEIRLHRPNQSPLILNSLSERELRQIRGRDVAMIFQEPMTSLNPVYTVGAQISEAVRIHQKLSRANAKSVAIRAMERVKIPAAATRYDAYPHQFSGGMRQRVMIAMALACQPRLLIADEPTTALDVTIQAQILDLLRELQEEVGLSILLITHDLGIVAEVAHEVAVMYASKVVEQASVHELFNNPRHPYTHGLFRSRPTPDTPRDQPLLTIPGTVPSPLRFPAGCKFHPRCPHTVEACRQLEPELREITPLHPVRCHLAEDIHYE
ncbi:MAG: ABC transporter ATP-binding protein [Planctomycetota bacterium]|nr:ABC transporter ATP-binding protein [Planctomycetota bacterium]MDA1180443.1 ABC transporter ATP-binding protein [Planctomycetota bacterium]